MYPRFNTWRIALLVLRHELAKTAFRSGLVVSAVVAGLLLAKAFA